MLRHTCIGGTPICQLGVFRGRMCIVYKKRSVQGVSLFVTVTSVPDTDNLREIMVFWVHGLGGFIHGCLAPCIWAERHSGRNMWPSLLDGQETQRPGWVSENRWWFFFFLIFPMGREKENTGRGQGRHSSQGQILRAMSATWFHLLL